MTCIVNYKTKKALREAIADDPANVWIDDPSIFEPRYFNAAAMNYPSTEVVTNHPKRSWFAQITRASEKQWSVS